MIHLIASLFLLSTLTVRAGWVTDGVPLEPTPAPAGAAFTNDVMPVGLFLCTNSEFQVGFQDPNQPGSFVKMVGGESWGYSLKIGGGVVGEELVINCGEAGKLLVGDTPVVMPYDLGNASVQSAANAINAEYANFANEAGTVQSLSGRYISELSNDAGYVDQAGAVEAANISFGSHNVGELGNDIGYVTAEGATAAAQAWVEANDYVQSQSLGGASVDYASRADTANSAESANSANYAASAGNASTADNANYANFAGTANSANSCENANEATHAQNAGYAESAGSAQTANSASSADSAQYASSAGNADSANSASYANEAGSVQSLSGHSLGELNNDVGYISQEQDPWASSQGFINLETDPWAQSQGFITEASLLNASVAYANVAGAATSAQGIESLSGHSVSELANDMKYITFEDSGTFYMDHTGTNRLVFVDYRYNPPQQFRVVLEPINP